MPQTPLTDQHIVGVTNAGAQFSPAVAALPNSFYVITWLDEERGAIYGQRYDATGQRVGEEFQVSAPGPVPLFSSVAALLDGGFVVAWQSGTFNSADIHARRYDSSGQPVGAEFTVNSSLPNEQLNVHVIGLDNGGFLFTWDNFASNTYLDVSARLYNSLGQPLGPDFTINTTVIEPQGLSTVTPLSGGGFVATWLSVRSSGVGADLFGQRFDSSGGKIGAEFQVNTSTTNSVTGNDVARLSDGSFVVSWIDPVPSNGGGRVVARHYSAAGVPIGGEITIFSKASAAFGGTSVTALPDGGYLVGWSNRNEPSTGNHLSAQQMDGNDLPVGTAFDVSPASPFETVLAPDGLATLADGNVVFAWDGPSTNTSEDAYYRLYSFSAGAGPITGTPGPDVLPGTPGDDVIQGLGGNDILAGLAGADRMEGGTGNDTYYVDNVADVVVELAGEGFDAVYASTSYALAAGAEVEWLSAYRNADTFALDLTGNALGQYLVGNDGANILDGGGGADTMIGLGGDDSYRIDNAFDIIVETAGNGFDSAYASVSYALAAGVSIEMLGTTDENGTTAINLIGNELAQTLVGNDGANVLDGGGGADAMTGKGGNDIYLVDNAGDTIGEGANGGFDAAFASVSWVLTGGAAVEWLSAASIAATDAIDLTGNALGQYVVGNNGANVLNGGAGNDTLIGNGGADIFQFTTAPGAANADVIADFLSGTDRIALDDAVFTQVGAPGALAAGAFVTGTAAADADDRIVYNSATGELFYDADGSGAGAAILFATLQGHPVLAVSDFIIV